MLYVDGAEAKLDWTEGLQDIGSEAGGTLHLVWREPCVGFGIWFFGVSPSAGAASARY
jgi:hypothetical protein